MLNLLALSLMVSEKKIFEGSLALYIHMTPLGVARLDWQDLYRGPLNIATY